MDTSSFRDSHKSSGSPCFPVRYAKSSPNSVDCLYVPKTRKSATFVSVSAMILTHAWKTMLHFLANVTFSVVNVMFFSARDHLFYCGAVFHFLVMQSKTVLQRKCNIRHGFWLGFKIMTETHIPKTGTKSRDDTYHQDYWISICRFPGYSTYGLIV